MDWLVDPEDQMGDPGDRGDPGDQMGDPGDRGFSFDRRDCRETWLRS